AEALGPLENLDDLTAFGEAALWSGRAPQSAITRQRVYAAHSEKGDDRKAALVALDLVINYVIRLSFAVAGGWLAKARRHLEATPDVPEYARLVAIESLAQLAKGDLLPAMASAEKAVALGKRHGVR